LPDSHESREIQPEGDAPVRVASACRGALNGNAEDGSGGVLKIVGRSAAERQIAFAQERGRRDLDFLQTVDPAFAVFKKG
jgi:hypothetical protein